MKYTFEARAEDGSPRRFAGTWRPPFEEVQQVFQPTYFPSWREQWARGDFDRPLYETEETQA